MSRHGQVGTNFSFLFAAALVLATVATSAAAQCGKEAGQAEPATEMAPGQDGTAPGNSASTGWTGGTGGSYLGTSPQGATGVTKTWHAPTARGLDLAGRPEDLAEPPDLSADRRPDAAC
jgi:hypothetical protein